LAQEESILPRPAAHVQDLPRDTTGVGQRHEGWLRLTDIPGWSACGVRFVKLAITDRLLRRGLGTTVRTDVPIEGGPSTLIAARAIRFYAALPCVLRVQWSAVPVCVDIIGSP
jgi:hypothetical protein